MSSPPAPQPLKSRQLLDLVRSLGASAAVLLPVEALVVDERFASFCGAPHRCPSYGLAPGCPPHAPSPARFRESLAGYRLALVFKIDVPAAELLDERRLPIARAIHRIASGVERAAHSLGFHHAQGMAAGSCKELFCNDETHCAVLALEQPCLYPDLARPSLSAVGIDFADLAARAGWPFAQITTTNESAMALMAGLVLLD